MRRIIGLVTIAIVTLLGAAGCSLSNDPVDTSAVENTQGYSDVGAVKLEVGKAAPAFSLLDAKGQTVNLSDYQGQSSVMLLFYRGSWCPYCVGQLEDIQALLPKLKEYNVQLLAISPDSSEDSQELAERFQHPYRFLNDQGLNVADAYGVRKDKELPHPAVVLIDREGKVAWFYIGEDYTQRPSSAQLEAVIKRVFVWN